MSDVSHSFPDQASGAPQQSRNVAGFMPPLSDQKSICRAARRSPASSRRPTTMRPPTAVSCRAGRSIKPVTRTLARGDA